jgi:hypothetical protein
MSTPPAVRVGVARGIPATYPSFALSDGRQQGDRLPGVVAIPHEAPGRYEGAARRVNVS